MIAESTCVFCVVVAVKKTVAAAIHSFPILRDTGSELNRAVGAVQRVAHPLADILAPVAQSGGDGASGGTGRKLDLPFGAHMELWAPGRLARCPSTRQERRLDSVFAIAMNKRG